MTVKRKVKVNTHSSIPADMQKRMTLIHAGALKIIAKTKQAQENSTPALEKALENVVPLKRIAAKAGIDPRAARRILRSAGKKPSGRWEWPPEAVPEVERVLAAAAKKAS